MKIPIFRQRKNIVYDDDNDYFKIDPKSSEGSKQKIIVALDFASRKVIESTNEDVRLKRMLLEDSIEHLKRVETIYKNIQKQSQRSNLSQKNNVSMIIILSILNMFIYVLYRQ